MKAPLIIIGIYAALISGCDAREEAVDKSLVAKFSARETEPDPVDTNMEHKKRGTLALGAEYFKFDTSMCFGTSTATAIASDSMQRSDYPVVTLKTYDPAMSGGISFNTASALFERDGHGEHWRLHEGSVEKDGDVFTASGTLEGNLLLPKPDGTRESAPLEGDDILPFEVRIEC